MGHGPQPALGDPALSKEVGPGGLQGPFHTQPFCNAEIHGWENNNNKKKFIY